jgi:hypothetical protein
MELLQTGAGVAVTVQQQKVTAPTYLGQCVQVHVVLLVIQGCMALGGVSHPVLPLSSLTLTFLLRQA